MRYRSVATLFSIAVFFGSLPLAFSKDMVVDFGYRPQQWRTVDLPAGRHVQDAGDREGRAGVSLRPSEFRFRHVGSRGGRRRREDHGPENGLAAAAHRANATRSGQTEHSRRSVRRREADARSRPRSRSRPSAWACRGSEIPWNATGPSRRPASPSSLPRSPAGKLSPSNIRSRRRKACRWPWPSACAKDGTISPASACWTSTSKGRRRERSIPSPIWARTSPALFWFDAKDVNNDGLIDLTVTAAKNAKDKNTILNGFWVFDASVKRDDAAVLSGSLDSQAISVNYAGQPDFDSRKDFILVHVTNNGDSAADDRAEGDRRKRPAARHDRRQPDSGRFPREGSLHREGRFADEDARPTGAKRR